MDLTIYEREIKKTGFELEYRVASAFRRAGWSVIANKYYVDDQQESVREIDLVAYKVTKSESFQIYTTLIVSCKKSEKNVWAFLSKERPDDDPNADWFPAHVWSNHRALAFCTSRPEWRRDYHKRLASAGLTWLAEPPEVDVFAFQEMNKTSGAPQNDRPLFESATSLMKAQAYELGALPVRKRNSAIYQFNLVTVADTDFVRLHFDKSKITGSSRTHENYFARYIIDKKQTNARVYFCTASHVEKAIGEYNRLHSANSQIFSNMHEGFFEGIVEDEARLSVFLGDFKKRVLFHMKLALTDGHPSQRDDIDRLELSWSRERKLLSIAADISAGDAPKAQSRYQSAPPCCQSFDGHLSVRWRIRIRR